MIKIKNNIFLTNIHIYIYMLLYVMSYLCFIYNNLVNFMFFGDIVILLLNPDKRNSRKTFINLKRFSINAE
jgi:hypothetical protein